MPDVGSAMSWNYLFHHDYDATVTWVLCRHPIDETGDKGIIVKLGMPCIINRSGREHPSLLSCSRWEWRFSSSPEDPAIVEILLLYFSPSIPLLCSLDALRHHQDKPTAVG